MIQSYSIHFSRTRFIWSTTVHLVQLVPFVLVHSMYLVHFCALTKWEKTWIPIISTDKVSDDWIRDLSSIIAYTKNWLVSWSDDKELSSGANAIGWNSLKIKNKVGKDKFKLRSHILNTHTHTHIRVCVCVSNSKVYIYIKLLVIWISYNEVNVYINYLYKLEEFIPLIL